MKLAMPVRVLLISILGTAFFVTPLLVVNLRFRERPARLQVHVWSLWLTIIWAASCGTYLIVDLIPRFVVGIIRLFGGQIERLKIQVEVWSFPLLNKMILTCYCIAYNGCQSLVKACTQTSHGPGSLYHLFEQYTSHLKNTGMSVNSVMQVSVFTLKGNI
jgi:hypothetical protein